MIGNKSNNNRDRNVTYYASSLPSLTWFTCRLGYISFQLLHTKTKVRRARDQDSWEWNSSENPNKGAAACPNHAPDKRDVRGQSKTQKWLGRGFTLTFEKQTG